MRAVTQVYAAAMAADALEYDDDDNAVGFAHTHVHAHTHTHARTHAHARAHATAQVGVAGHDKKAIEPLPPIDHSKIGCAAAA